MKSIKIDFGNLIKEMETKNVKLFMSPYLHNGWFLSDRKEDVYHIEICYCGGYLDDFIIKKRKINFELVDKETYLFIKDFKKEIYDIPKVKKFIGNVVNVELGIKPVCSM